MSVPSGGERQFLQFREPLYHRPKLREIQDRGGDVDIIESHILQGPCMVSEKFEKRGAKGEVPQATEGFDGVRGNAMSKEMCCTRELLCPIDG
jgi:hypothetical protein